MTRTCTWIRKEHTTRCADPTVVVTWLLTEDDDGPFIVITEFQNVYCTTIRGVEVLDPAVQEAMTTLHRDLEQQYDEAGYHAEMLDHEGADARYMTPSHTVETGGAR